MRYATQTVSTGIRKTKWRRHGCFRDVFRGYLYLTVTVDTGRPWDAAGMLADAF